MACYRFFFKKREFTWKNRRKGFLNIVEKLDIFLLCRKWDRKHWELNEDILSFIGLDLFLISLRIQKGETLEQ